MAGDGFRTRGFGSLDRLCVTVGVRFAVDAGPDAYNIPRRSHSEPVDVAGCLVARGATDSLDESRPDGARVDYTVHFPDTFAGDLRGAHVLIPGEEDAFEVVGDPKRGPSPLRWNMPVEVRRVEG